MRTTQPKRTRIPDSHAVLLHPPCPELQHVHELAKQHFDAIGGATLQANLQDLHELQQMLRRPQRSLDPLEPPPPPNVSLRLRTTAMLERHARQVANLRDQSYRFARNLVFMETGVRVGPVFWEQLEDQDEQPEEATSAQPQPVNTPQPAQPAQPQTAQAQAQAQAPSQPKASNKCIKATVRKLARTLPRDQVEAFRKQAIEKGYTEQELQAQARRLLAA